MPTEVLEQPSEVVSSDLSGEKEVDKPRRGRPPKDDQAKPSFFDSLKTRDWERTLVYLYRTAPLIDRTIGGDKKYICKFSSPFDEDQVMREYGSGGYIARVTESLPGKTETKPVDQHSFTIMNLSYPPQVPLGQWLDDNRNEQWKWAKDLLEAKQRAPQPQPPAPAGQDAGRLVQTIAQEFRSSQVDPTIQFKAMTDAHQTGLRQGLEIAGKPAAASGESEILRIILPLLAQPKGDDSVVKLLTMQLENEREQRKMDREQAKADREAQEKRAEAAEKRHGDLLAIMLAKKEDSGTDVITKFGQMFTMVNQIREGAGLGATDDSWTGLLKEGIREALPSLAPAIGPMIGGVLQSLPLGPRPNVPVQNVPRGTSEPVPAAQPQPQPQPEQDPHLPAFQFIVANFGAVMAHLQRGSSGLDFGDWIAEGPGQLAIDQIKAAGTERIIAVFKTIPQAWEQWGPVEPRVRQFLNELMTWTPEEAGGDDDEGNEPDPNVPVGKVEVIAPPVKTVKGKGKK